MLIDFGQVTVHSSFVLSAVLHGEPDGVPAKISADRGNTSWSLEIQGSSLPKYATGLDSELALHVMVKTIRE